MTMDCPRWSKAQFGAASAILNALMELPPEERMDAIALACKAYCESEEIRNREVEG